MSADYDAGHQAAIRDRANPTLPHKRRRSNDQGDVLCSWCEKHAYVSLWAPGWPTNWLGDACTAHRAEHVTESVNLLRIGS